MFDSISEMLRPPRLVILEIKSREGSSSMSDGFLEFLRVLNSMSFKELKEIYQKYILFRKNTSFSSFKCLQSLMVRPLHLQWIRKWQFPHWTA